MFPLQGFIITGILTIANNNNMKSFQQFLTEENLKTSTENKEKTARSIARDFITLPDVEGFREEAYKDPVGIWTVGPGITRYSTGMAVGKGDIIPKQYGMKELDYHLDNVVIPTLSKKIPNWDKMNENQKASLISFSYNAGQNFYGSKNFETITNALSNPSTWNKVPDALKLYNKGKNPKTQQTEILPGLVKRRENEANMWSGTYTQPSIKTEPERQKKRQQSSQQTTQAPQSPSTLQTPPSR